MRKLNLTILATSFFLTSAQAAEVNFYISDPDSVAELLPDLEVIGGTPDRSLSGATPSFKLDAERMKLTAVADFSDAMRRLPGVTLRDYGGLGGLKTLSVRGLGSEHTTVVYDGAALSDCQSGQVDLSRYSLNNLSSIRLFSSDNDDIFLPARSVSGASALYISSFDPDADAVDNLELRALMKAGSFGFYNPWLRVEKDFASGWSVAANAEFSHADNDFPFTVKNGVMTTRERRNHSKMNSVNGALDLIWRKNGYLASGKIYYYDSSRDLPGPVLYYVSDSDEHLDERNAFGQLHFKGKLSSVVSLMATMKFNYASSFYKDVDEIYPGGMLDNRYRQREAYITAAALLTPFAGFSADYSVDWIFNNLSTNKLNDSKPYRNTVLQSLAAKYNFKRVSVMGRLLWSIYRNGSKRGEAGRDYSDLSPAVNVSYRPFEGEKLYLRGSYKKIFRLPTFNELYFDNRGSLNLEPEKTSQFNLGVAYGRERLGFIEDLAITVDGYINEVRNKIVAVPYNMFIWNMTNLGKVKVAGADITFSATGVINRKNSVMLTGSYSYQRARPRTTPGSKEWNKQVAYIPEHSGSGSLSWLNPWVNVAVTTSAIGHRFTSNSNIPDTRIDGFMEFGGALFRTFRFRRSTIEGRLELLNIFNKQYEIIARYPMPGRSWRISVEYSFSSHHHKN